MKRIMYIGRVGSGKTTKALELAAKHLILGDSVLYVTDEMCFSEVVSVVRKNLGNNIFSGLGSFDWGCSVNLGLLIGQKFDVVIYDVCRHHLIMPNKETGTLYVFEQANGLYDELVVL